MDCMMENDVKAMFPNVPNEEAMWCTSAAVLRSPPSKVDGFVPHTQAVNSRAVGKLK